MSQERRTRLFQMTSLILFMALILVVTAPSRRAAYLRNLQRQGDVAFIAKVLQTEPDRQDVSLKGIHDPLVFSATTTGYLIVPSSTAPGGFGIMAPHAELGVRIVYPH